MHVVYCRISVWSLSVLCIVIASGCASSKSVQPSSGNAPGPPTNPLYPTRLLVPCQTENHKLFLGDNIKAHSVAEYPNASLNMLTARRDPSSLTLQEWIVEHDRPIELAQTTHPPQTMIQKLVLRRISEQESYWIIVSQQASSPTSSLIVYRRRQSLITPVALKNIEGDMLQNIWTRGANTDPIVVLSFRGKLEFRSLNNLNILGSVELAETHSKTFPVIGEERIVIEQHVNESGKTFFIRTAYGANFRPSTTTRIWHESPRRILQNSTPLLQGRHTLLSWTESRDLSNTTSIRWVALGETGALYSENASSLPVTALPSMTAYLNFVALGYIERVGVESRLRAQLIFPDGRSFGAEAPATLATTTTPVESLTLGTDNNHNLIGVWADAQSKLYAAFGTCSASP